MKTVDISDTDFKSFIQNKNCYVDKTEYLWKLITRRGKGIYFLSRPRRFGKSLLLSTLKATFQGEQELFEGLAIYDKYDWTQTYPVIHIDFVDCDSRSIKALRTYLLGCLQDLCNLHQIEVSLDPLMLGRSFNRVIRAIATKSPAYKVVILVDEYDKPMINNLDNPKVQEITDILRDFFSTLKSCNDVLRLVFITGISKFSHVSIFSGLNNLEDISMHPDFATMLGYTQKELETYFSEHIDVAASYRQTSREKLLTDLKEWYDGYRFCKNADKVYNPFSIACFFNDPFYDFQDYWYSTATPSSLKKYININANGFELTQDLSEPIPASHLGPRDLRSLTLQTLLFQTGYLTIKETSGEKNNLHYILDYPNFEVENSYKSFLLTNYLSYREGEIDKFTEDMKASLHRQNLNSFINHFNTILASISYEFPATREGIFQAVLHATLFVTGFRSRVEVGTSRGRIDHVLELPKTTYIIEHKLNQSANVGLKQIKTKGYADAFLYQGRKIILLGINFSSETYQVNDWKAEVLSASGEFEKKILPPQSFCKKNSPKKTPKKLIE